MRTIWAPLVALAATLVLAGVAHTGVVNPHCTVGKAAKGAVERSTVGVGNRCKPGETARDVVGGDNKKKRGKHDAAPNRRGND